MALAISQLVPIPQVPGEEPGEGQEAQMLLYIVKSFEFWESVCSPAGAAVGKNCFCRLSIFLPSWERKGEAIGS